MVQRNYGGIKNSIAFNANAKRRKMKKKIFYLVLVSAFAFASCSKSTTALPLEIQKPYSYSDEYFANLRAYKKTDHQVFYGWYAAYAQKEGVTAEYKKSPSWGEHIAGLPDSLDFCSLWMGVPSMKMNDSLTTYNPIAYTEMRKAMEVRGIRMLIPTIVNLESRGFEKSDDGLKKYAKFLTDQVFENDLDGLDLDWEPASGAYLFDPNNFAKLVQYCSEKVGPMSGSGKYLVVDYYQHTLPNTIGPYIDYLVNQAYTQGTTSSSATFLQNRYNLVSSWCPPKKFIVTENFGDWWDNGGSPFTEANGNTLTKEGNRMYSMEGMARWQPVQGKKAGFGAFYFDRDYNNSVRPYNYVRRAIQIVNPAAQ
jgi:hypothetical protein